MDLFNFVRQNRLSVSLNLSAMKWSTKVWNFLIREIMEMIFLYNKPGKLLLQYFRIVYMYA